MAIVSTAIQGENVVDFVNQVNTYLATLANPLILAWSVVVFNEPRRLGQGFKALITSNTGGPSLGTPFLLDVLLAPSAVPMTAAIATYRTTYAGQFISSPQFFYNMDDQVTQSQMVTSFFRNVTAGASANYTITG
jgi:hypothetical protein